MGLDMDLTKRIYIGAEYDHNKITGRIELYRNGEPIEIGFKKVVSIIESAGYWRKANAIHSWFVENVQDGNDNCGEYYVSHDQMQELLNVVNTVLSASKLVRGKVVNGQVLKGGTFTDIVEDGYTIEDPTVAMKLLPTTSGFFFGSTGYDEWYYKNLEYTKEVLEEALSSKNGEFYYASSW